MCLPPSKLSLTFRMHGSDERGSCPSSCLLEANVVTGLWIFWVLDATSNCYHWRMPLSWQHVVVVGAEEVDSLWRVFLLFCGRVCECVEDLVGSGRSKEAVWFVCVWIFKYLVYGQKKSGGHLCCMACRACLWPQGLSSRSEREELVVLECRLIGLLGSCFPFLLLSSIVCCMLVQIHTTTTSSKCFRLSMKSATT